MATSISPPAYATLEAPLLAEGLREAGVPADRIEMVYRELDAVEHALDLMGPRDLVVVLADDVEAVLACVRDAGVEH